MQWTSGQNKDDSKSQVLQPDVITMTVPVPPYGACEGISDNPTGDYTGSYEDTGGGALTYNVASKTVCNCSNNLTFMDNVNHKGFDNSITVVVFSFTHKL